MFAVPHRRGEKGGGVHYLYCLQLALVVRLSVRGTAHCTLVLICFKLNTTSVVKLIVIQTVIEIAIDS